MTIFILTVFIFSYWLLLHTSHLINSRLTAISLLITRSSKLAIIILSFLLLPGTILHELSHALMATILRVHVGGVHIFPRSNDNHSVQLGFVEVAKTDFIRRNLIGFAPTFSGSLAVLSLIYTLFPQWLDTHSISDFIHSLIPILHTPTLSTWIILYLIFSISSSMHTSDSDREALPLLLIFITICVVFIYFFIGFAFISPSFLTFLNQTLKVLTLSFLFATILNFSIVVILLVIELLISTLTGRRVVRKKKYL